MEAAQMPTDTKPKRLTGKQASFVDKYLGEARFNASLAARLAGYKATSKHSFEAIGSENLTKPDIRAAIDDYFRMSRMSSDEILAELSELARTDSQEKHLLSAKVRSLALLCSHFGLLDGSGRQLSRDPIKLNVVYDQDGHEIPQRATELSDAALEAIVKIYGNVDSNRLDNAVYLQRLESGLSGTHKELNEKDELFTEVTTQRNELYQKKVYELCERYKDSPDVVQALKLALGFAGFIFSSWNVSYVASAEDLDCFERQSCATGAIEASEIEVIPPDRRLRPAAVERLMNEVKDTDAPQPSPVVYAAANEARPVTPSMRFCNRVEGEELEQLHEKIERRRGFTMY